MGLDLRRSGECVALFLTVACLTLLVARWQGWPFVLYELVLVAEVSFIVMRGLTAPR